jgi:hypothetical protein
MPKLEDEDQKTLVTAAFILIPIALLAQKVLQAYQSDGKC